jgi:hypothetical protein
MFKDLFLKRRKFEDERIKEGQSKCSNLGMFQKLG